MLLSDLLNSLSKHKDVFDFVENSKIHSGDMLITAIVDDSRKTVEGCCYVAIKGKNYDGYDFIDEAINNGAKVIVSEKPGKVLWKKRVTYIRARNSRCALSYLASAWYGNPSDKLKIIGITGTKGKTTSSYILYQLLNRSGYKVGAITSVGSYYLDNIKDIGLHVTNPEPLILQKLLYDMVSAGIEYVILEVTSHGLDQERVAGINFDYGVLTNIAPEHLDYHKTLKNYMDAKLKLFFNSEACILNKDDKSYKYFYKNLKNKKIITYSFKKPSDYKADIIYKNNSNNFLLHTSKRHLEMTTKLPGSFNLYNILSAISVASEIGVSLENIFHILKNVQLPAGRLEIIKNNKGIDIFIDFAHTPDSLKNVLSYLNSIKKNRLIVVFGSAGERDKQKRPMMGKVAGELADIVVLTAEDPRSEDVNNIIIQIESGVRMSAEQLITLQKDYYSHDNHTTECGSSNIGEAQNKLSSQISDYGRLNDLKRISLDKSKKYYIKIPDRGHAIFYAINIIAERSDSVVICGKGQEKSMCYGNIEYPWSDYDAVRAALKGCIKNIDYEN